VLVTDGDARAALAVTRGLGAAGHEVWVAAPRRGSLAGASRHCAGEVRQVPVADGPLALGESLVRAARLLRPDVVLGVTDASLTALHRAASFLDPAALPPPEAGAYFEASDKVRLFERCLRIGVKVPRGCAVRGGELPSAAEIGTLGEVLVVRPSLSWRVGGARWVRGTVAYVRGRGGVERRLAEDPALRFPYLVQGRIEGEPCGLFVLAHAGEILSVFSHRRLREKPPSGGVSTLCEAVAPPADLLASAATYLRDTGWSGLAMFEFKRSAETGDPHLLEINARPWGSMALAAAAGVDFAVDLLAMRCSTASGRLPGRTARGSDSAGGGATSITST
jgi:hypothetical protein